MAIINLSKIDKTIEHPLFGCLFGLPFGAAIMILPILPIMAIIIIVLGLINFEDYIIDPTTTGNYTPIIAFILSFSIIFAGIGWVIISSIRTNYKSKLDKLESNYKHKEDSLNKEHKSKLDKLESNYKHKEDSLNKEHKSKLDELSHKETELSIREKRFKELTTGKDYLFGKIPQAVSDIETIDFALTAEWLKYKPRPAYGTAEIIKREFRNKAKEAIIQQKIATYKLQILLSAFPSLNEYLEDDDGIEELSRYNNANEVEDIRDHSRDFLSDAEWENLSTSQRNQLALDRYIKKRKGSNWTIGRDYEMACAHILKEKGYFVKLHGIEKKLEDLGRDLIATKIADSKYEIYIIQCKYWSSDRVIHENVIMQLYGTTIAAKIENESIFDEIRVITPILMIPTFSVLSNTAQKYANLLNVKVVRRDLTEFPRIKCNINGNNKIYHLPFDQQYDRTQIRNKGEFYAWTVAEAEEKGFRRAMRHIYH